jgi:hypothetical protein
MPEFISQGLGPYFLRRAIDRARSYGPRRFWLHICTKGAGRPAELPPGFVVYEEGMKG